MSDSATQLNTRQFAEKNLVTAAVVRTRLCTEGSYFGIIPIKLANGRLIWPDRHATKEAK